jgi:hypothetical protein
MDPQAQFCHNSDRPARGRLGPGNIRIPSRTARRHRCTTCGHTFSATRDTPSYRLKKSVDLVTIVITLLGHGCPVQVVFCPSAAGRPSTPPPPSSTASSPWPH